MNINRNDNKLDSMHLEYDQDQQPIDDRYSKKNKQYSLQHNQGYRKFRKKGWKDRQILVSNKYQFLPTHK